MAYLDQLATLQEVITRQRAQFITQLGVTPQRPYASFYPEWETTTPQYQTPTPYTLAQLGYRTNELVYTCIATRSQAIAEAPVRIYDVTGDEPENIPDHPLRKLLKNPTPGLGEQEFWAVVETYCGIAGFSAWEKERNNKGEVIRLWPMRPDWCSFIRGQQKPIAAIRYQPWGMQFADIPIEDVLLFQYFDPLFPLLKGFSPLMVALDLVDTDNTATKTVAQFLKNGNFLGGVLKTEQALQEAEAERIKTRWRQQHGGSGNAGDIAVFGKGVEFVRTEQTFREATFPELDARSEARICMVYRVPPMLIGAKIGMDRSTYSNYKEARAGFYESVITSEWRFLAAQVADQLLPEFESEPDNFDCQFDTSKIKALQESRNDMVTRAVSMYEKGLARLNEARIEAGLDPIEGEEGEQFKQANATPPALQLANDALEKQMDKPAPAPAQPEADEPDEPDEQDEDAQEEIKAFRRFAKTRIKEGKKALLASFEFKHLNLDEQGKLLAEFGVHQDTELTLLAEALNKAADAMMVTV